MTGKTPASLTTRFLLCALSSIFLLGATAVLAQNNPPPLIDRELMFGNPEISGAQISPDGKFIAFRKPHKDTANIWVKRADEPFANARLLTNEAKRPMRSLSCSLRIREATRITTSTPSTPTSSRRTERKCPSREI
jgi:hypothetical protein